MNKEEAEALVGKEVYTIQYSDCKISKHLVCGVIETPCHNSYHYTLKAEDGYSIFNAKVSKEEASNSLLNYWEQRVELSKERLLEAQEAIFLLN